MASAAVSVILAVASGCDSKSPESSSEESEKPESRQTDTSQSADSQPREPPREAFGRRHERAVEVMGTIVEAARRHFESADNVEEATFPGGTDVEWSSRETVPEEGKPYELTISGGVTAEDGDATSNAGGGSSRRDAIAEALGLEPGSELPVRIVYRTGEGKGAEATATIRAVADFAPSNEADHTLVQELSIDAKTGEVNVFPRLNRHRWK